jgi:hypothetical protein
VTREADEVSNPFYKTGWFWGTTAGVVVAAAAIGFALSSGSETQGPTLTREGDL